MMHKGVDLGQVKLESISCESVVLKGGPLHGCMIMVPSFVNVVEEEGGFYERGDSCFKWRMS